MMIEVRGLSHRFGNSLILEDIDLQITRGEFVAIIGPNGAGKSTLIRLILGLLPVQSGSIRIDGEGHLDWLRHNPMGYLPQKEEFDRGFPASALDIVLMGLAAELPLGGRFTKS
ncbi:ATP-binding cassette domain-containing protein, partial [Candidatus Darwinibacter acetoxidans]